MTEYIQITGTSTYCYGQSNPKFGKSSNVLPYKDPTLFMLALTADGKAYSNISALSPNTGNTSWQLIDAKKLGLNGRITTIDTINKNIFKFKILDSVTETPVVSGCYEEVKHFRQYSFTRVN